jgi:hypothetical protein
MKKFIFIVDSGFEDSRKASLIENSRQWLECRGIDYDFCAPKDAASLSSKDVGLLYRVLTSCKINDMLNAPGNIPLLIDIATPIKNNNNIFNNRRLAIRNAFAQSVGGFEPELQVPMIPKPIKPRVNILRDVIVIDAKQFHTEDTHFYVMSLLSQIIKEWSFLEKLTGHKLYLYFTSFMKFEEYKEVFESLKMQPQFSNVRTNILEKFKGAIIPPKKSTIEYEEILHRCRLFITEHGDIADTDLAQVLCLGTPILTYKRIAFSESSGIQHMARKAGRILDPLLYERIALSNQVRIREEWGLRNIIKIDKVTPWNYEAFLNMHYKHWDIVWDWAVNGKKFDLLTKSMSSGGWNKGVKTNKDLFNPMLVRNIDNVL